MLFLKTLIAIFCIGNVRLIISTTAPTPPPSASPPTVLITNTPPDTTSPGPPATTSRSRDGLTVPLPKINLHLTIPPFLPFHSHTTTNVTVPSSLHPNPTPDPTVTKPDEKLACPPKCAPKGSENLNGTLKANSPAFAPDPVGSDRKIPDKPNWLLHFAVSFNILLIILSIILNLLIVTHYWNNSNALSSTLYLRNGIADSFSAIGFLFQVPLAIRVLEEDMPSYLILISYWITTVSVRMSVFMNCVLGVVRCINIVNPFYQVNRKYVTISTLIFLFLWATIASLDIWIYITKIDLQNKVYLIKSLVLKAEPGFSLTSLTGSEGSSLTSFSQGEVVVLQFLTPLVLPALLCFVLMIIQICHLTKQVEAMSTQSGADSKSTAQSSTLSSEKQDSKRRKEPGNHRKAAVTILIVTIIYVLTSILSVAVWLIVYRTNLGRNDTIKKLSWTELSVIYICSSTSPLLGSTITAITLLLRSSAMQRKLKEIGKTLGVYCSRLSI